MSKSTKIIFGIIFTLFGSFLLITSIMSSKFKAESSITILATDTLIFNKLNDLNTWKDWNLLMKIDPSMQISIEKDTINNTSFLKWDGKSVSTGYIKIFESVKYSYIQSEIFLDLNHLKLTSSYEIEKHSNYCLLKNKLNGKVTHPIGKILSKFGSKEITKQMENNLIEFKKYIEKKK